MTTITFTHKGWFLLCPILTNTSRQYIHARWPWLEFWFDVQCAVVLPLYGWLVYLARRAMRRPGVIQVDPVHHVSRLAEPVTLHGTEHDGETPGGQP
ncbi:hypothetical protein V8Z80_08260 [Orrella sp. JC864]|uniref:hypothetical protein n=1 Tax=Orrella sp. JC864 TaxID=3120298 RepID=UPI0030087983